LLRCGAVLVGWVVVFAVRAGPASHELSEALSALFGLEIERRWVTAAPEPSWGGPFGAVQEDREQGDERDQAEPVADERGHRDHRDREHIGVMPAMVSLERVVLVVACRPGGLRPLRHGAELLGV
jgi:hypothetical protein